jgi:hypothetical protein
MTNDQAFVIVGAGRLLLIGSEAQRPSWASTGTKDLSSTSSN